MASGKNQVTVGKLKPKSKKSIPMFRKKSSMFALRVGDVILMPAMTGSIWKSAANIMLSITPSVNRCVKLMAAVVVASKIDTL
jgi:hypothetical protein